MHKYLSAHFHLIFEPFRVTTAVHFSSSLPDVDSTRVSATSDGEISSASLSSIKKD